MSIKRKEVTKLEINEEISLEKMCLDTWKDLYRFIYYKVQNKEEAEDITQETYMRVLKYIERTQPTIENQLGYLKVIALNIIRDHWRKQKKVGSTLQIEDVKSECLESEDFSNAMINQAWIKEALQSLSIEQRRIIELRIIKGYSAAETAKVVKKNEGTIRVIQFRALKTLAKVLYQVEESIR